jgi:hypothetical protein
MPRHVDVHDAPPIVDEDDEDEQDPAGERRDREEVDRDSRAEMVLEERAPALRGWLPPPRHQPRDRPLRDLKPQLQQFPMDARRTPEWVSRRPSPGPGVGRRRRSEADRRADAIGVSSTTRSRGDARRQPSRVGRPSRPTSSRAIPIAVQSRTVDRSDEWGASVGCAGTKPTADAAPGFREPKCGVGSRERSGAEQRG